MSLVGAFTTVIRSTVITIALLIFAASAMAAPQVVPYEQLGNKALYPARVIAVNFAGNTLQNGSPVSWGAWTVSLESGVAHLRLDGGHEWGMSVDVKCENAVQGAATCELHVGTAQSDYPNAPACSISSPMIHLAIVCPLSLTLDY